MAFAARNIALSSEGVKVQALEPFSLKIIGRWTTDVNYLY
jgi:hypothetical protein